MRKLRDTRRAGPPGPKIQKDDTPEKGAAAFDIWLQRGLHHIYDAVASEPVPKELLRLIEEDRQK